MSQDPIQEALDANQRRADEALWKEINRILAGGPNGASAYDIQFLTARRSYLTEAQKDAFGIVEYVEPSQGTKAISAMNKAELQAKLTELEIPFTEEMTKAELLELFPE